jgi:predicted O-linked N-acetylglucosamine transferase (SPINDLY family)
MAKFNLKEKLKHVDSLIQNAKLDEASQILSEIISLYPNHLDANYKLGAISIEFNKLDDALNYFKRCIVIDDSHPQVWLNLGNVQMALGYYSDSIAAYEKTISLNKNFVEAYSNLSIALRRSKNLTGALKASDIAIEKGPDNPIFYNNRGLILNDMGRFKEAVANYYSAINLNANYAESHYNLGMSLVFLNRHEDAIKSYKNFIKLNPSFHLSYIKLGNALFELHHFEEAIDQYKAAINLKPDSAEAYFRLGNALGESKRNEEAIEYYKIAIRLWPDFAEPYNNLGNLLAQLKRNEEAIEHYETAIRLKPDYAEAYFSLATLLNKAKLYEEAIRYYDKAIRLKPDMEYVLGEYLYRKMNLCDWRDYDNIVNLILNGIKLGKKIIHPSQALSVIEDPKTQKDAAEIFARAFNQDNQTKFNESLSSGRIRIGYFSADFGAHVVAYLTKDMYKLHDRDKFEVFAFSLDDDKSIMASDIKLNFDHFFDVGFMSDQEIISLSSSHKIDIAIDLGGYTEKARPSLFSIRLAPIQVSYVGYLGTTGSKWMDYLIADNTIVPDELKEYYSEKIINLPSFQVNSQVSISNKVITKESCGLPNDKFIFCCFNQSYKITPSVFSLWMEILRHSKESVIWLISSNDLHKRNVLAEAVKQGVNEERIIFAPYLPYDEHLKRLQLADLFLDTSPYNAGVTASDALRVGIPVISRIAQTFAGRMGASILKALQLDELIVMSDQAYIDLAIRIYSNPNELRKLKDKIYESVLTSDLYKTEVFVKNLESVFMTLHEHYCHEQP